MWCLRRKIKANFIFYFEYIGVIIQTHILKYFFRYKVWLKKIGSNKKINIIFHFNINCEKANILNLSNRKT